MLEYVASYLHLEEWPLHHIMQSIELWLFFPQYCCISLKLVCLFLQILAIGYLSCKITMKMKVSIFCSSFTSILKYLCRIKSSFVKVAQSCQTLCNPMDCTLHGVLQAIILEWVAFSFFRGSSQPRDWTQVSCIAGRFFTSWATREAQEYWSG